jgi:hypothetical protein
LAPDRWDFSGSDPLLFPYPKAIKSLKGAL